MVSPVNRNWNAANPNIGGTISLSSSRQLKDCGEVNHNDRVIQIAIDVATIMPVTTPTIMPPAYAPSTTTAMVAMLSRPTAFEIMLQPSHKKFCCPCITPQNMGCQ